MYLTIFVFFRKKKTAEKKSFVEDQYTAVQRCMSLSAGSEKARHRTSLKKICKKKRNSFTQIDFKPSPMLKKICELKSNGYLS